MLHLTLIQQMFRGISMGEIDITNPYVNALISAILVPMIIFSVGFLVEKLSNAITRILARFIGEKAAFFIRNRLTFIGTVHHELSHAFFALISGAKVTKVKLFKLKGQQLGFVEFVPRGNAFSMAIQMTLTSIAPIVCGAASLCLMSWLWRYKCSFPWQYILVGYLFVSVAFHLNMSDQDIKNSLKGIPVIILICFLAFLFTGVSIIG